MANYNSLDEFLLSESVVFQKVEDTNPLYYFWAVLLSNNGRSEDEIRKDENVKKLFRKIDKFCDKYRNYTKGLKNDPQLSPESISLVLKGRENEWQRKTIENILFTFKAQSLMDVKSFNEWKEVGDAFDEWENSEEVQAILNSL